VGVTTDIVKFQNRIQFGPPFCLSKNQQNSHIQHEWYNDTRSEILTVRSLSIEGSVNAAGELRSVLELVAEQELRWAKGDTTSR
jgi:hypothetical protein